MSSNFRDVMTRVTAKAWADPAYKARLLADPAGVLEAEGLPADTRKIYLHEDTDDVVNYVIPAQPTALAALKEVERHRVADFTFLCLTCK